MSVADTEIKSKDAIGQLGVVVLVALQYDGIVENGKIGGHVYIEDWIGLEWNGMV